MKNNERTSTDQDKFAEARKAAAEFHAGLNGKGWKTPVRIPRAKDL
jgi:hypothetical protein